MVATGKPGSVLCLGRDLCLAVDDLVMMISLNEVAGGVGKLYFS